MSILQVATNNLVLWLYMQMNDHAVFPATHFTL